MFISDSALQARSLGFSYDGRPIIHDITLDLRAGSVLAITGANGTGKSTLIGLLAGYLRPHTGDVKRSGPVALVLQSPQISAQLPLSVGDVVALGTWRHRVPRRTLKERISNALIQVGLQGYQQVGFAHLSGGQRQRALLAQALVQRAPIMLLDEPGNGIDVASMEAMHRVLDEERNRGAAIGLVTHDPRTLGTADHVFELRQPAAR